MSSEVEAVGLVRLSLPLRTTDLVESRTLLRVRLQSREALVSPHPSDGALPWGLSFHPKEGSAGDGPTQTACVLTADEIQDTKQCSKTVLHLLKLRDF